MSDRQSILVTGAAAGIGRAVARHFAEHGWYVGLYDLDGPGLRSVYDEIGPANAVAAILDVTDPRAWQAALSDFWAASGSRLDVLVNNAGILASGEFAEVPLAVQHRLVDVNVKGVLNGCHAAFRYLRETPGSVVVNLCSASAIYGQPSLATYSATKFAVRGLTEALDIEWAQHGISVRDVWPLYVQTAMVEGAAALPGVDRYGVRLTPEDVARVVCRAANSRRNRVHWRVGRQARLNAAAAKLMPAAVTRWFVRRQAG